MPPLLGSLVFLVPASIDCAFNDSNSLGCDVALGSLIGAFLIMGLPSIIYSMLMEYVLNPRIKNGKLLIAASTILGILAGSILDLVSMTIIGGIVGFIVGLVLRSNYENDIANKRIQADLPTGRPPRRGVTGLKSLSVIIGISGASAIAWYIVEPYAVTFIDDGPYYSSEFSEEFSELPVNSTIELRRFGRLAYILESRDLTTENESVLILRDPGGSVQWTRKPIKPDGELGTLELQEVSITWNGGWRIRIKPKLQEGGFLYLSGLGGFRFFNHSW